MRNSKASHWDNTSYEDHEDPLKSIHILDRAQLHTIKLHFQITRSIALSLSLSLKLFFFIPLSISNVCNVYSISDETLRRKLFNWFDIEVEIETMPLNRDNDGIIFDRSF